MNVKKPRFWEQGGEGVLNPAGIIRWIFGMDAADLAEMSSNGKADMAAKVLRFQERARGALASEAAKASPRTEDEVLWTVGRGEALQRVAAKDSQDADAILRVVLDAEPVS